MFLTYFMMGWIVLTVLSLCLPVWSAVTVIQPYRVVSTNGTATIQCFLQPQPSNRQIQASHEQTLRYPYPEPEELSVRLLKGLHGTQEICSSILNLTEQREAGVEQEGDVRCYAQVTEGALEVTVSGLKAKDTDMYRCEVQIFYPPPYLQLTGNGTLIHVLDSSDCPVPEAQRQITDQGGEEEDGEGDEWKAPLSAPVVVLLILVTIVLIIIICAQTFQCERGRREIARPAASLFHKGDAAAFSCHTIA